MIVQLNENVKCNAKRKIKNICICLLLFFFAFAIMIRYQRCGALAQLVEQAFRCLSPVPILHRKAVNVKSAQNLAGIFGAIAQLVARYIRIVEVSGSNPLCSTTRKTLDSIRILGSFFLYRKLQKEEQMR